MEKEVLDRVRKKLLEMDEEEFKERFEKCKDGPIARFMREMRELHEDYSEKDQRRKDEDQQF